MRQTKLGFTLVELLVVVLIIGVLIAIALPMYQKTVLKSRFSALMPIVKAINDSNEMYYLEHSSYASDPQKLPVQGQENYPEGTELELSSDADYTYVLGTNTSLNNNYLMYQKQSANFPGEIHCEALKTDDLANWLCSDGLHGTRIAGSITDGYNTYILQGTGSGTSYSIVQAMQEMNCQPEENSGNKSCTVERTEDRVIKTVCTNKDNPSSCTYYLYGKDGLEWGCPASKAKLVDGTCMPTGQGVYAEQFDEDGNRMTLECLSYNSTTDGCKQWAQRIYNANSTKIQSNMQECTQWDSDGRCIAYKNNAGYESFGTLSDSQSFSSNPTLASDRGTFNPVSMTTEWTQLNCATTGEDGLCTSYKNGYYDTTTWDENGRGVYFERKNCSEITSVGECGTLTNYQSIDITYTDSGKVDTRTYRSCLGKDEEGNCTAYTQNDKNNNYQESYTYNERGSTLSYTRYRCNAVTSATQCDSYATGAFISYTYNSANKETSRIRIGCDAYNAQKECTQYNAGETNTYNTYAANGTTQTSQITNKCNAYSGTVCTGGWTVVTTPYVNGKADNNNKVTNSNCSRVNIETGVCLD